MKGYDRFQLLRAELNAVLLERETAVDTALLALISGEHVLFLGPPGTAKSLLVRSLTERIRGSVCFERMLTRFSTPEELFGPLSLKGLEHDRYQRVTAGSIVESHIAFIDEVFKANSSILNSLLTLMNERLYHESGTARKVPLRTLFGASNELPEDASLNAMYDRFLLRVEVPYLADDASVRALLSDPPTVAATSVTLTDITDASQEAMSITLTDTARDAICQIRQALFGEGIAVSDRRWKQCGRLVQANAWMQGDTTTSEEHCDALMHCLWDSPDNRRVVERCVSKVANPLHLEAVELEDAAHDLYQQRPGRDSEDLTAQLEPLLRQLSDIHTRLQSRINATTDSRTVRARQALQTVERYHRELSSLALRSLSRLHTAPGAA